MAFDRAGAKAAGYTDAEIDEYIKTGAEPAAPVQESSAGGPGDLIVPAVIGAGITGAGIAAKKGLTAASQSQLGSRARAAAIKTLAKDQGPIGHLVRFFQEMDKSAPVAAKGKVPSRAIKVEGKPKARAPVPTSEPPYTGGRGASGPELERRAAALAQVRGGAPPLSLVPQEMPALPPAASLEEQLQRAVAAEQAMGARGIPAGQGRTALRAGLRSALPPALEALTFLLGAQDIPGQLEEARRQYLQGAHPDLYRMLYENPNQRMPTGI